MPQLVEPTKATSTSSAADEALIARARKRWDASVKNELDIRREAELDMEFVLGEQWDALDRHRRSRGDRPMLTFNKLHTQVQQLSNQAQQNKPAIRVNPAGSGADRATAQVMQGLIRHIEYDSSADLAYETALENAASCSLGALKLEAVYDGDDTFNQKLVIRPVFDAFSVRFDFSAKEFDKSDAMWAFQEMGWFSNEAFEEEFGRAPTGNSSDFSGDLQEQGLCDEDGCIPLRYWEVDLVKKTLREWVGEDGIVHPCYLEDLADDADLDSYDWTVDQHGEIREREVRLRVVTEYIIEGDQVVDESQWMGSSIPLIPVQGKKVVKKGKVHLLSLIRFARDAQREHNYVKTLEVESIALAPKPKWVGYVGQFRTKSKDWQNANNSYVSTLEADVVMAGDRPAPLPQWQSYAPNMEAFNMAALSSADDIKAATGQFDPSLGEVHQDLSGVAQRQLQTRGDISNLHFIGNLARGMKTLGRYTLEVIPQVYTSAQEIEIEREDNRREVIMVNAPYQAENGQMKHHKLDVGKYACVVSVGPSAETQRQDIRQTLSDLSQTNPQVAAVCAPTIVENWDFPGSDALARGLRALLPAPVQQAMANDGQQQSPQIQGMAATIQQLQQQMQAMEQLLKTKQLEMESKERQTTQTNMVKLMVGEAASKQQGAAQAFAANQSAVQSELQRKADLLDRIMQLSTESQLQQLQQAHEANIASQQQQHEQQLAQMQQAAQAQSPQQPA